MPGHIVDAICGCGFEVEMFPGANDFDAENVIAYDKIKNIYDTIPIEEANRDKKEIIDHRDDIFSDSDVQSKSRIEFIDKHVFIGELGVSGPLNCPSCNVKSLFLFHSGFWD